MHEHAFDFHRLIGAAHPALDALVRAPARALPRHERRKIASGEADQRISLVERGHHYLAHLAFGRRLAAARADDLDNRVLVDDHAFHGRALVGDAAQIGSPVGLQHGDAARAVFLAQAGEQRAARDQRFLDRGGIAPKLAGLVEDRFQIIRRARIARRLQVGDGLNLHFGVAWPGRKHGKPQGARTIVEQKTARCHVIGEAIVQDLALAEAGRMEGTGKAPRIRDRRLRLEYRSGRHENPGRVRAREAAERRGLRLKQRQLRFAQHGKLGQRRLARDLGRVHTGKVGSPAWHPGLELRKQRRKLGEKLRFPLLRLTGLQIVEERTTVHRAPPVFFLSLAQSTLKASHMASYSWRQAITRISLHVLQKALQAVTFLKLVQVAR